LARRDQRTPVTGSRRHPVKLFDASGRYAGPVHGPSVPRARGVEDGRSRWGSLRGPSAACVGGRLPAETMARVDQARRAVLDL